MTVHLKAVVSFKSLATVAVIVTDSFSAVSLASTGREVAMSSVEPEQVNFLGSLLSPVTPSVTHVILLPLVLLTFSRVSTTVCPSHSVGDFKPQEIVPEDVSPEKTAPLVSSSGISQFKVSDR